MKLKDLSVTDQYHQFLDQKEPAPCELNQSDQEPEEAAERKWIFMLKEWKSWIMNGAMKINLPRGQCQERGLESAGSGARVLGELEPIPLLELGFQSPDLQSAKESL